MNSNIYIDEHAIDLTISKLKNLKQRLETTLNNQKEINKQVANSWKGTCGNVAYNDLVEHSKRYDEFVTDLNNKITFLEKVKNSYSKMDKSISDKLDSNAK